MMQPQASSARLKIEFAQASDPGRDPNKQINEDSCGYNETVLGHLGVLCDGMGGHYGGREASQLAIKTIFEVFEQRPVHLSPAEALKTSVEEAGRRVYTLGGPPENRTRPGSTCVAVLLHDRGADVAHVGDSRAYVIRAGQIYPVTRDHSMVQGMIDAGLLTEEQAIGHPDGNKITRALGMRPEVDVEVRPEPMDLFPGDIFLLASDGLTDLARPNEILGATKQALASGSLEHACIMLVQLANDRGGHDNITVQMARVLEVAPKVSATIPQAPAMSVGASPTATASPTAGTSPTSPTAGAAGALQPQPQPHGASMPKPLSETIQMTRPDTAHGQAHAFEPPAAYPGSAGPAYGPAATGAPAGRPELAPIATSQAASAWSPVGPTASGSTPPPHAAYALPQGASAGGSSPTAPAQGLSLSPTLPGAPSTPVGMQPGPSPTMTEPAPISEAWHSQRFDSQLPSASLAQFRIDAGPGALPLPPPRPGSPYPQAPQNARAPQPTIQEPPSHREARSLPPTPPGYYPTLRGSRPSKGGIVFVIMGLSAVIAVLLVIVLWAVLRDP